VIFRIERAARPTLVLLTSLGLLTAGGRTGAARAQDTTASGRVFLLEARVGTTEALGATSRSLVGPDAAIGVTFGFQLRGSSWGWASADYRPGNSSTLYPGPGMSPWISLYTVTVGVSRAVGLPFAGTRWRPFEVGLGVGATQVNLEATRTNEPTTFPPDAEFEDLTSSDLLSSSRWRPAAAARLRVAIPLVRAVRLSATAGLIATHVGDVRLWNGRWEPTGEGSRYRPSTQVWSYGTILTVPLTVGVGFRF
jgi:hypothetical protein